MSCLCCSLTYNENDLLVVIMNYTKHRLDLTIRTCRPRQQELEGARSTHLRTVELKPFIAYHLSTLISVIGGINKTTIEAGRWWAGGDH